MPSEDEFQAALSTIEEYVSDVGGEVAGKIDAVDGDDSVKGFLGRHGGSTYQVYGSPDELYFRLQAKYDVTREAAGMVKAEGLKAEDVAGESGQLEVEIEEEDLKAGLRRLGEVWRSKSGEERAGFAASLTRLLARDAAGYAILKTDGVPHGVRVVKKIYPYEDGFDRRRFDDAVMTVLDVLIPARQQLRNAYDVTGKVELGGGSAEDDDTTPDRAFR